MVRRNGIALPVSEQRLAQTKALDESSGLLLCCSAPHPLSAVVGFADWTLNRVHCPYHHHHHHQRHQHPQSVASIYSTHLTIHPIEPLST